MSLSNPRWAAGTLTALLVLSSPAAAQQRAAAPPAADAGMTGTLLHAYAWDDPEDAMQGLKTTIEMRSRPLANDGSSFRFLTPADIQRNFFLPEPVTGPVTTSSQLAKTLIEIGNRFSPGLNATRLSCRISATG